MHIGLVIAQAEEAVPIIRKFNMEEVTETHYRSDGIDLVLSGVGKLPACVATNYLLENAASPVTHTINAGVAAGRGWQLKNKDIIIVDKVYDGDFDLRKFDRPNYYVPGVGPYIVTNIPKELLSYGVRLLPCYSISRFLEGGLPTGYLHYVVDMEYYGIAYACMMASTPSTSIKIVSDTSTTEENVNEYNNNLEDCCNILADYLYSTLR